MQLYTAENVYYYTYGVAYFPDIDGNIEGNMIPIYTTNEFSLGEYVLPQGWQINESSTSFALNKDRPIGADDKWTLFVGADEGNGTWYYFEPAVEYATKEWVLQQIQAILGNQS